MTYIYRIVKQTVLLYYYYNYILESRATIECHTILFTIAYIRDVCRPMIIRNVQVASRCLTNNNQTNKSGYIRHTSVTYTSDCTSSRHSTTGYFVAALVLFSQSENIGQSSERSSSGQILATQCASCCSFINTTMSGAGCLQPGYPIQTMTRCLVALIEFLVLARIIPTVLLPQSSPYIYIC